MKRVIKTLIIASAAAVVLAPLQARADGFVTPWVGSAFGSNISNGQTTLGVSAGGMGAGIIGGEVDFGWSPSFFGSKSDFGNNTVMDLMGNLIIGVPIGGTHGAGVRPYVVGGVGLLRTQIDGGTLATVSSSDNMFALGCGRWRDGLFQRSRRPARRHPLPARRQRSDDERDQHRRQRRQAALLARVDRRDLPLILDPPEFAKRLALVIADEGDDAVDGKLRAGGHRR